MRTLRARGFSILVAILAVIDAAPARPPAAFPLLGLWTIVEKEDAQGRAGALVEYDFHPDGTLVVTSAEPEKMGAKATRKQLARSWNKVVTDAGFTFRPPDAFLLTWPTDDTTHCQAVRFKIAGDQATLTLGPWTLVGPWNVNQPLATPREHDPGIERFEIRRIEHTQFRNEDPDPH